MTTSEFSFREFADPERASRTVVKLHELFIASGSSYSVDEFARSLSSSLQHSPDPDLGITNLLRFVEATTSKESLFNDFVKHSVLSDVLIRMLSSSQYFADILVRDPELFRWLTASDSLIRQRTKDFLREEVERSLKLFQKPERKLNALKRLYRREILRIGARDILGEANLQTLTEELSHLADVLVDASCTIAHQQLAERYPDLPQTSYAVIGLGKLGGCELNYSSDIDIIFVYKDEGELEDAKGQKRTHHEYFNAFVEKMIVNLTQSSTEGHLYRVDTRLRPESGAGPLARSVASYLLYYESRGELWERQMLIKARAVAGDLKFGEEFIAQLAPFVYPRTFFQNPREHIARIKARIEAAIAGEENVKLRAGGIRDIEFIVQALQLLNGGKNHSIRSRNTLEAIEQLAEAHLLSQLEHQVLTDAYIFFRTIEHRLQMMLNIQTQEIPKSEKELATLAKKVGVDSVNVFRENNDRYLAKVRGIFESVLIAGAEHSERNLATIIEGNLGTEAIAQILSRYSFHDTRKAAKNLGALMVGSSLWKTRELDARAKSAFRELAEELFAAIAKTPSPDMTLHNLARIAVSHKFPEQLYEQLKEENFRKLLLTVCAQSPRFAKGLERNPLLLETLATDPRSLTGGSGVSPLPTNSTVALKSQEELRTGIRYILGISTFDEMAAELSLLADIIVTSVLQDVRRATRSRTLQLAIFALGKYGTREINFDSDLDILFISNTRSPAAKDTLEKMATTLVNRLSAITEQGKLYDVDARLRPEGKSAPLVVDRNAYLAYLAHRASLWERQSLTRLRFVAGDEKLGNEVVNDVQKFVYESTLPKNWVDEIVKMRKKTETRAKVTGSALHDVKLSAGGMVDIEFLAQMIQLKFGKQKPMLRHLSTSDVFKHASPLMDNLKQRVDEVLLAYRFYRRIETCLRITLEERGNVLPEGAKLDLIAKVLDGTSGEEFHRMLDTKTKGIRQIFLALAKELAE
jgi:glutamate-ammonia-ligase adenylyltransferase